MRNVYQITFRRRVVTHEEADVAVAATSKREAMQIARKAYINKDTLLDWHPQGDLHMERPVAARAFLVPDDDPS